MISPFHFVKRYLLNNETPNKVIIIKKTSLNEPSEGISLPCPNMTDECPKEGCNNPNCPFCYPQNQEDELDDEYSDELPLKNNSSKEEMEPEEEYDELDDELKDKRVLTSQGQKLFTKKVGKSG